MTAPDPAAAPPPGFRRRVAAPRVPTRARWTATLAPLAIAAFFLANHLFGWGLLGDGSAPAREVQTQIAGQFSPQIGVPLTVTCPGDLPGKVGTTIVCTAPVRGQDVHFTVRVTGHQGGDVLFDVSTTDVPPG